MVRDGTRKKKKKVRNRIGSPGTAGPISSTWCELGLDHLELQALYHLRTII